MNYKYYTGVFETIQTCGNYFLKGVLDIMTACKRKKRNKKKLSKKQPHKRCNYKQTQNAIPKALGLRYPLSN